MEFEQVNVSIPDEYKEMYDMAAGVWLEVKEAIDECKQLDLIAGNQKKVLTHSTCPAVMFACHGYTIRCHIALGFLARTGADVITISLGILFPK